jgi:small redox-active disulfide protein 2
MSQEDIMRIKVGGQSVGITGLKRVMEEMMAEAYGVKSDGEIQAELLKRLSGKNYIPDGAKENYGGAFLREFKKILGKPFGEDVSGALEIKVLGPGCAQCDRLERELMETMAEMNLAGDIEHVRDIKEIGKYGVMGTPALIVNKEIKAAGHVPPRSKILEWLKEGQSQSKGGKNGN